MSKLWLPLFALVMLMAGCGNSNQQLIENAPLISRTYTDDLGREIKLQRPPKRIVSLAPSTTEMIFAVGAEDLLVARSEACDYPPEVEDYPAIVTYPDLDLPGIVTYEPDLIIATDEIFDVQIGKFFDRYHIPLYFQSFESIDDVYRNMETLGEMVDHKQSASTLVDSLRRIEKRIVDSTAIQAQFRSMILVGVKPIIVAGGTGYLNELLTKSGSKNAFGNIDSKYPVVTPEAILEAAPEVIIIPSLRQNVYQDFASEYPLLHLNMPAAQSGRIYQIDPDLVLRPGPRTVEGLAYLARTMHARLSPEEFLYGTE